MIRLKELLGNLETNYEVLQILFEGSSGSLFERDIVIVKDTSGFVQLMISKKGLDISTSVIDSGGGFMKICVCVFRIDEKETCVFESHLDGGVQKAGSHQYLKNLIKVIVFIYIIKLLKKLL